MEQTLISQWDRNKENLRKSFEQDAPGSYDDIFKRLFETVLSDKLYQVEKITVIDDGDYQGTRIFVIPEAAYQPCGSDYLVGTVSYGSCSGCDTFYAIQGEGSSKKATKSQIDQYMTLALHFIQELKPLV